MTLNVLECLLKKCTNSQIIAISGRNETMNKKFKNLALQYNRTEDVRIFEFTDKVAEFMSISSLVVTKPGGLTSSESLVSHLPMVIINPIPGQEEENAQFLETKKVAKWIKKDDDINFILNILVNDDNILNNMKENTYLIAKPNATENICKIIMN